MKLIENANNTVTFEVLGRNSLTTSYDCETTVVSIYGVSKVQNPDGPQYEISHDQGVKIIDGPSGSIGKYFFATDYHGKVSFPWAGRF